MSLSENRRPLFRDIRTLQQFEDVDSLAGEYRMRGRYGRKRAAMMHGRTQGRQGAGMFRDAVALVALEPVSRMHRADAGHQAVAHDFGDDRSGGDRGNERIAGDHGLAIAAAIDAVATVDKDELGRRWQSLDGPGQRPQRGAQNVVAVDARR